MSWVMSSFTAKQKALAIVPHFTGAMSIIGSGCIIKEVVTDREKRKMVYHRLLLGMSCCDILTSFWYALSTWPIPKGTAGIYAASGTTGSCSAQGFFIQSGLATPLYNFSLAWYYLLVIRYQWKEDRLRKAEPYMHFFSLTMGLGTAFACLPLKLFNNANLWCWIASLPTGCDESYTDGRRTNCIRGDNAWIYRWALFYAPLWFCVLMAMVAMGMVYQTVLKQERKVDRYSIDGNVNRKQSGRVASQALCYILAFYLAWIAATLTRLTQTINGQTYYPLLLLMSMLTPLQGFLNYVVYIRPRYLKYRKDHPDLSFVRVIGKSLARTFSCHWTVDDDHNLGCRPSHCAITNFDQINVSGKPTESVSGNL